MNNNKIEIIQAVYPREEYNEELQDAKNKPYACVFIDAENNSIIEEAAEDTVLTDIEKTELTEGTSESKEAVVDDTNELSDEEIAAAKEIAAGYYSGTVFEVNSMEFIEAEVNPRAEGECNFMVNVSIGGVVQEVDRMISLNKVNGLWEVVSEGY